MKTLTALAITAFTVALSSCASTSNELPSVATMLSETTGQNGRACVRKSSIRGYGVLEHNIVSIDGSRNYYLATVLPGCTDLVTSIGAVFTGGFGEICGLRADKMNTRDNRCTINRMFEFENREQAFDTYNAMQEKREELKNAAEAEKQP